MSSKPLTTPLRSIRSFVIREGRFTAAQKKALLEYWPKYGIPESTDKIKFNKFFLKKQPLVLDVGFGNGDSLLSLAQQREDLNFIGVEVYRPGIGNVLRKLEALSINNVRIVNNDVTQFLRFNVHTDCLQGILVWFPDPWPKKRHHKRRLVQREFLQLAINALQTRGVLHLASDWYPYIEAMRASVAQCEQLEPIELNKSPLKLQRPLTRFEQRGLRLGHKVIDLFYQVNK